MSVVPNLAGAVLVPARARWATRRAVLHLVPVLLSDGRPSDGLERALCGARTAGEWFLRPDWPEKPCPLCRERAAEVQPAAMIECPACEGEAELSVCANDGTHGCSHVHDRTWPCRLCGGTGTVTAARLAEYDATADEDP